MPARHDHRDLAVGVLLVRVVVRPLLGGQVPETLALLALAVWARAGITSSLTWISTDGSFSRFRYQPGCSSAPPLEAMIT
jgi:hypothetical protein